MRELDSLHYVTGILYPNRCDNEAYISQRIDLTNMNAYIAKKNETETEFPYTMFHLVLAALMKTITLRPKLNRFIVNSNFYQRNEVSASFVVKKQFSDKGAEALAFLHCKDEYTLSDIHDYIRRQVTECRSDKVDPSTGAMDILNKIPRFVSKAAIHLLMWLDKHGWVPADIIATDPTAFQKRHQLPALRSPSPFSASFPAGRRVSFPHAFKSVGEISHVLKLEMRG